jgi:hypothetical protein
MLRWIALAVILASLPAFVYLLRNERTRDWAVLALGGMMFMVGKLQIDAAIISWPLWPGPVRGVLISPVDTLALALIVTRGARDNRIPFPLMSLLFLVPIALSIVVSNVPMASAMSLLQAAQLILFATAIAGEMTRPSALPRLLQGLSLGLIVQAGFVVQQKLAGVVQADGTLDHQNSLGMMVELAVLPLIGYLLEGGKSRLCYAGVAAGLLCVAGGGSRGTLLFLAIGLVVLVLFSLARGFSARKGKMLAAGIVAALIFVPLSVMTLKDRFGDATLVTEEKERVAMAKAARAMAADHPLGVGANTYVTVANTEGYAAAAGVAWREASRVAPVHHVFLLKRAETGRLGEITLYLLMALCAWRGLSLGRRARAPLLGGVTLGGGAAAVAALAHGHYEYVFSVGIIQRLFWLNIAIVFACLMVERRLSADAKRRRTLRARTRRPEEALGHDNLGIVGSSGSAL